MIKLGKVYGNLMVDVKASNKKLEERAIRIVMEGSGCERTEAEKALKGADGHAKLAILMVVAGVSAGEGKALLERTAGHHRDARRRHLDACSRLRRPEAHPPDGHLRQRLAGAPRDSAVG